MPEKTKRFISIFISAVMLLALLPGGFIVARAESGTCGPNLTWTLNNGVLIIAGTGDMYDYDSWENPSPWGTDVTSVVIGSGVTSIGNHAFRITGLTSVTIPDSVKSIGDSAFFYCCSLKSVTIGNGVMSIGGGAFNGCTGLTSITIPDGVTSIGWGAFEFCDNLRSVTIPDSVTSIEWGAFEWCPDVVLYVVRGSAAHRYAESNGIAFVASGGTMCGDNLKWVLEDGVLTIEGDGDMWDYSSEENPAPWGTDITSVVIGNSVTSIGMDAFHGCTGLTSITIPDSVTAIRLGAFDGCAGLTSITIPDSVTVIEMAAFADCAALTSVTIPDSMTYIAGDLFNGCTALTSVTIPDSVKSIYEFAFEGCTSLTSITIPDSVTNIEYAFLSWDDDAGNYKPLDITLRVYENSYAHQYAVNNGLDYEIIKVLSRIAVTTLPAKTTYFKYKESLDVTGGRITLYYSNSSSEVIDMTADMVSGFDNGKLGTQTLTVTYGGKTATFNVNVVEKILESIAVTTLPEKTEYQKGEALDVTGGKITLYYSDGSSATINMSASMVSGFDSTKAGEQTLTVTYGGKTATFGVTIVGSPVAKGDADGDGEITVADALIALRIAAKLVQPTEEDLAACDTDGDGEITVADALKILRVAAKLIGADEL